jgi:hypothetical protein
MLKQISSQQKMMWLAAAGAAIGLIIASFRLPGGDDLYRYYLPFVNGCLDCGYVPYFAQWFLWPMNFLPAYPYAWPVWTIFCVAGFLALAFFSGVNPLLLMVSFPMLGQIWLGQIDFLVSLGLVLLLFGRHPFWRGTGIILALTKPQLTVLPILFSLLLESPRAALKLLIIPLLVLLTSLFVFGLDWPIHWFKNAAIGLPAHVWRLASSDIWKFGIFLTPIPLWVRGKKERLLAGLLISSLATPFYGVYSYIVFLLFDVKWPYVLLSYAWLLGFVFWKETAMRFAWILPLAMLIYLLYTERKLKRPAREIMRSGENGESKKL